MGNGGACCLSSTFRIVLYSSAALKNQGILACRWLLWVLLYCGMMRESRFESRQTKLHSWPGSSVGWSLVLISQGCGSWYIQEATNEFISKWNNKSMFLSLKKNNLKKLQRELSFLISFKSRHILFSCLYSLLALLFTGEKHSPTEARQYRLVVLIILV